MTCWEYINYNQLVLYKSHILPFFGLINLVIFFLKHILQVKFGRWVTFWVREAIPTRKRIYFWKFPKGRRGLQKLWSILEKVAKVAPRLSKTEWREGEGGSLGQFSKCWKGSCFLVDMASLTAWLNNKVAVRYPLFPTSLTADQCSGCSITTVWWQQ